MSVIRKLKILNNIVQHLNLDNDHQLIIHHNQVIRFLNQPESSYTKELLDAMSFFFELYLLCLEEYLLTVDSYEFLLLINNSDNEVTQEIRRDFLTNIIISTRFTNTDFSIYYKKILLIQNKLKNLNNLGIHLDDIEQNLNNFIDSYNNDPRELGFRVHFLDVLYNQLSLFEPENYISSEDFVTQRNSENRDSPLRQAAHFVSIVFVNIYNFLFVRRDEGRIAIERGNTLEEIYENFEGAAPAIYDFDSV